MRIKLWWITIDHHLYSCINIIIYEYILQGALISLDRLSVLVSIINITTQYVVSN